MRAGIASMKLGNCEAGEVGEKAPRTSSWTPENPGILELPGHGVMEWLKLGKVSMNTQLEL